MPKLQDSVDLYTSWKHDEQLQHSTSSAPAVPVIPFKLNTTKFLVPTMGEVLYTDGYSTMKQDDQYERTLFEEEMEVPSIGTDKKNFEIAEMITFDISGASTHLPLMCKTIIYNQGATHEREPPILVRDTCVQWDGIDRPRRNSFDSLSLTMQNRKQNGLGRARSSEDLLDDSIKPISFAGRGLNDTNRCSSLMSSLNDDDDAASIVTAGGTVRHRISRLLYRHKYLRQMDSNLLGRYEFYSVPFYQYRGRRYGQNDAETQVNESDLNNSQNDIDNVNAPRYSVTIVIPVHDRNDVVNSYLNLWRIFNAKIPTDTKAKHTTVGYINTKQYVTVQRTLHGQVLDA